MKRVKSRSRSRNASRSKSMTKSTKSKLLKDFGKEVEKLVYSYLMDLKRGGVPVQFIIQANYTKNTDKLFKNILKSFKRKKGKIEDMPNDSEFKKVFKTQYIKAYNRVISKL